MTDQVPLDPAPTPGVTATGDPSAQAGGTAAGDYFARRIGELGDTFGDFSAGAQTDQRFWLGLGFAYMTVITGIAYLVSTDVVRYRPLLLVLAAGKVASSITTGVFFLDDDVFINLLNFLVDGSLVFVALFCWSLAGKVAAAQPG